MTKCLLCNKEGQPSNGLSIIDFVCEEHHKLLKELENQNKRHHERAIRKICRAEARDKRS
jgi:hypothetical protein